MGERGDSYYGVASIYFLFLHSCWPILYTTLDNAVPKAPVPSVDKSLKDINKRHFHARADERGG